VRREHCRDILVLDASMPDLDGLEVYALLRDDGRVVPTVFLTATIADETLAAFIRGGVDGIVTNRVQLSLVARERGWVE
jgi:CheY-like chemotaxis protein